MITVDEALSRIVGVSTPVEKEKVSLDAAYDRVTANPISARFDQPPFSASAMDGYAIISDSQIGIGDRYRVVGISSAGARFSEKMGAGEAVRIFTGAPVPLEATHVIIQEEVEAVDGHIVVKSPQARTNNIRLRGCDFAKGDVIIGDGARLTGPMLTLAAAAGHSAVSVRKRPRIALIANGDELVLPGESPGPDEIVCSIPFGLKAMIADWGGEADFIGIAKDNKPSICDLIRKSQHHDIIVPIGGASVGDRDLMRLACDEMGFEKVFAKVSVKPGKPVWLSTRGDTVALGLPGNPASALVTAVLFLKPAIETMLGDKRQMPDSLFAKLTHPLGANGPRETYLRALLSITPDKSPWTVKAYDRQDSSLTTVMAEANALLRRKAGAPAAREGDLVECIKLN